jgi:hypothetical protein
MERLDEKLRVGDNAASRTIAMILRHDYKQNSHKLGFLLIKEFRVARQHAGYRLALSQAFERAVNTVARSIKPPSRYSWHGGSGYAEKDMEASAA